MKTTDGHEIIALPAGVNLSSEQGWFMLILVAAIFVLVFMQHGRPNG